MSAVIGHRLNELSNDAVELLEVAAVIGQRFDVEVLAAVTEQNPTRVTELLEEALQAGIVVETGELDVWPLTMASSATLLRGRFPPADRSAYMEERQQF